MNSPLFSIEARISSTAMYKSLMTSLLTCFIFFGCVCDVLSGFSTKKKFEIIYPKWWWWKVFLCFRNPQKSHGAALAALREFPSSPLFFLQIFSVCHSADEQTQPPSNPSQWSGGKCVWIFHKMASPSENDFSLLLLACSFFFLLFFLFLYPLFHTAAKKIIHSNFPSLFSVNTSMLLYFIVRICYETYCRRSHLSQDKHFFSSLRCGILVWRNFRELFSSDSRRSFAGKFPENCGEQITAKN